MKKTLKISATVLAFCALNSNFAFADVPSIEVACQISDSRSHDLKVSLDARYTYSTLNITTSESSTKKAITVNANQINDNVIVIEHTALSDVQSISVTYRDPDTQDNATLTEDVDCQKQPVTLPQNETQTINPKQLRDLHHFESQLTPLNNPLEPLVPAVANEAPSLTLDPQSEGTQKIDAPTDLKQTENAKAILGIKTALKSERSKRRVGQLNSKKQPVIQDEFDFSEDIEDVLNQSN